MELQRGFNSDSGEGEVSVHKLFEECVKQFPGEVALIDGIQTFTYKELNDKAERLSKVILQHRSQSKIFVVCTVR